MVRWARFAWLSGVVFVVCVVVGTLLFAPPGYGSSRARLVSYIVRHHRRGEVAGVLAGLALIAFLVLLGAFVNLLRERGAGWLASVAFGGNMVALAVGAVQTIIVLALSYRVAKDDPTIVKGVYGLQAGSSTLLAFPLASLLAATALAGFRSCALPTWYTLAGALAAVIVLARGGALAHTGFYSPGGSYGTIAYIAYIAFLLWTLATSTVLAQHPQATGLAARPVPK